MSSIVFAMQGAWLPAIWGFLGVVAAVGLLAVLSPRRFAALSKGGNRWIDTDRLLTKLDQSIDIDRFLLPYSRLLGVAVVASVALIGWLMIRGG